MKKFLVTTNVKGMVNGDPNTMYLGVWAFDAHMQENIMPYLWDTGRKNLQAARKCESYYEYFLDILTKELNSIHRINQSKQYYRIILGNWLQHYISVNFDRFMNIYLFHKKYGNFDTILLSEEEYFVPNEFYDFFTQVIDDPYNYQIYSNVIRFFFPSENHQVVKLGPISHKSRSVKMNKSIFFQKISLFLNNIFNRKNSKKFHICHPYFGENIALKMAKLILKSKFKIIYSDMNQDFRFDQKIVNSYRKKISIPSTNPFKKYIGNNILKDVPMIYLEAFSDFRAYVKKQSPNNTPSILYTSIGLHANNAIKFYAAEHLNTGMKVISNQHGASYGTSAFLPGERYERSVSDYFFTAGWSENDHTVPFGMPKLCKNTGSANSIRIRKITYITTYHPKYLVRFDIYPNSGYYHTVYFERMRGFLTNYNRTIESHIQIKSYPHEVCFGRITEIVKNLDLDIDIIYTRKIPEIFYESKLIVMDHMGTPMLEAIALNKPIVMVLDPNLEIFREDAQKHMDALEGVGIVHYSITGAINHIETIESNVDLWWCSTAVQQVVNSFRNHYAKCEKDWIDNLIKQFEVIGNR